MLTIDEINAMSLEQMEATNKKIAKKILTYFAVRIAAGVAISLAVNAVVHKLTSDNENNED